MNASRTLVIASLAGGCLLLSAPLWTSPASAQPATPAAPITTTPTQPTVPLTSGGQPTGVPSQAPRITQPGEVDNTIYKPQVPLEPQPQIVQPIDPANLTPAQRVIFERNNQNRPFQFQTPLAEARFGDMSVRLSTLEQKLQTTNQDLLRKVGEARQLSGDRQDRAVLDILQAVLMQQQELQRYLVHSRAAWSGEDPTFDTTPEQLPIASATTTADALATQPNRELPHATMPGSGTRPDSIPAAPTKPVQPK